MISELNNQLINCHKCCLANSRHNVVLGQGPSNANIVFIGEAPGCNEDLQGKPFIGRAGEVFDELLNSVNLSRNKVYITNVVKCRPPSNRKPLIDELNACKPFLDEELRLINPRVICPMGNFAVNYLFTKHGLSVQSIGKVHGREFKINTLFGSQLIFPLYHPAFAVYDPNNLSVLKKDFITLVNLLSH